MRPRAWIPIPVSIRARVTWAIMLTTFLALTAAAGAFAVIGYYGHKRVIIKDTELLCQAMGQSLDAAIEFDNRSDADRLVRMTFGSQERITDAWVLDARGNLLVSYTRDPGGPKGPPSFRIEDASRFAWPTLEVSRIIRIGSSGRPGGAILVRSHLGEMREQLELGASVTLGFLVIILFGSFLLARAIRGGILHPIHDLRDAVRSVTAEKRYSVRVAKREEDELGELVDAFNEMLTQIQLRDRELESAREHLEESVDLRTRELLDVNRQLTEATHRSEEANRAKSAFLASISHELRTPLNAIILYSELLRDDAERSGDLQAREDLGRILSSGEHLLALINDVLDLAKIESGRVVVNEEEMDPGPLAWEAVHVIQPAAAKSANRLEVEVQEGCPRIRADRTKLRQALVNLLSNACKFTREGSIRVEVEAVPGDGARWVCFRVKDTGIGIAPDHLEEIFSEFRQGDRQVSQRFGGTGLGLAISRRLVRLMGGDITVESEVNRGSTFTLRMLEQLPAAAGPERGGSGRPGAGNRRAFVAERDSESQKILSRILVGEGCTVRFAAPGEDPLEGARGAAPSLIVLPLGPGGDGTWDTLRRIRKDPGLQGVPVLLTLVDAQQRKGIALGALDVFRRPFARGQALPGVGPEILGSIPKVLLVEGDPEFTDFLRTALSDRGCRAEVAPTSVSLDVFSRSEFGLVICDPLHASNGWPPVLGELGLPAAGPAKPSVFVAASRPPSPAQAERISAELARLLGRGAFGMQEFTGQLRSLVRLLVPG